MVFLDHAIIPIFENIMRTRFSGNLFKTVPQQHESEVPVNKLREASFAVADHNVSAPNDQLAGSVWS